jgi:hypothetical protein
MPPTNLNSEDNFTPNELSKHSMPKFGKILFIIIFTTVGVISLSFGIVYLMKYLNEQIAKPEQTTQITKQFKKVNLQPTLDRWLSTQVSKKNSSILIYDLNNQEIIARNNDFSQNNSLGLENLFLAYQIYTKINQNAIKKDKLLTVGTEQISIDNCLSKILQENHPGCAAALVSEIGENNLNQFLKDQSYTNTNFTSHLTNTADLLSLSKRLNTHPDFSEQLWQEFKTKLTPQDNSKNPLLTGFSKLTVYGLFGSQTNDVTNANLSYPLFNNLYFLETKQEDPKDRQTFVLIFLASDIDAASLIELAKNLEAAILE